MLALTNHRLISNRDVNVDLEGYRGGGVLAGKAVLVDRSRGCIVAIVNETEIDAFHDICETIDLQGCYLCPGFIDLQVYGAGGMLFGSTPSAEALHTMELEFKRYGTTGFLATMATNSFEVFGDGIVASESFLESAKSIGSFWGLHFEGPFISPARRGAHLEHYIVKAEVGSVGRLLAPDRHKLIKMVTVAPECADTDALRLLRDAGLILSCGHTDATFQDAVSAFLEHKFSAVTHLYNAMPSMHHRNPGIIPAIFEHKPYTSIVADGIHVDYTMIKLAKRELGSKLFLITDAVTTAKDGLYPHQLHGDRYTMPDGTLSGSALSMIDAVKNCVTNCDISLSEAVRMASLYPAEVLHVNNRKGVIKEGFDADLAVFDDNWVVRQTFIGGVCVFAMDTSRCSFESSMGCGR